MTTTHPDAPRVGRVRPRATSLRAESLDPSAAESGGRRRRTFVPLDDTPLLVTGRPSSRLPTRRALALALVGAVIVALSAITAPAKREEPTPAPAKPAKADRRIDLFAAWDEPYETSESFEADSETPVGASTQVDTHRIVLIAGPSSGAALPPESTR